MQKESDFYRINIKPTEMSDEERDLGFGSVVARESRERLLNQDGTFNVQRTGFHLAYTKATMRRELS